ncbi:hypothetical protein D9M68_125520 [compost metagenome]
MTSYKNLRWYLLLGVLGALAGVLSRPAFDEPPSPGGGAEWAPSTPNFVALDESVPARIASMHLWGSEPADGQGKDERISVDSGGVARIKVDWLFRGVIDEPKGRFALIAKDAASPVLRYPLGASLPGGEHLEQIDVQGIRFSLSEDGEGREFERKLYAPLD